MDKALSIGIDISKPTLDICLYQGGPMISLKAKNTFDATKKALKAIYDRKDTDDNVIICAGHTGHYSCPLIQACLALDCPPWLEGGAQIKLSSGVTRGKDDRIGACRIAVYAHRFADRAQLLTPTDEALERLSFLQRARELYVKDRSAYKAQLTDMEGFMPAGLFMERSKRLKNLIKQLDKVLKELEGQIDRIIRDDENPKAQFQSATSVTGVGKQTAIETIVATKGFTKFDNARKFCCHIGVAPFGNEPGSSIRRGKHVSHRANKKLKSIYHMAALSAVSVEGGVREYFLRKVEEGKNKMSVINAVRAKIVHRIFALVRQGRLYDKKYENSLTTTLA